MGVMGRMGEMRIMVKKDDGPTLQSKFGNSSKAIQQHVNAEDKTVNESFSVNGTQVVIINESGLYSLILSSQLEQAKAFKRWVTCRTITKDG